MLTIKLLFVALTAGFVAAQTNSSSGSSSSGSSDNTVYDVNNVDRTMRVQWCNDQTTNCPLLCGGRAFTKDNRCIADPISYTCTCANGTTPDLGAYANTFVSDECQNRFAACRQQNPGSQNCITCGTLKAQDVPASTSKAAAASTSSASASATGGAGTTTAPATSKTSNPANALVGAEMGIKGAVGLLAVMGLVI